MEITWKNYLLVRDQQRKKKGIAAIPPVKWRSMCFFLHILYVQYAKDCDRQCRWCLAARVLSLWTCAKWEQYLSFKTKHRLMQMCAVVYAFTAQARTQAAKAELMFQKNATIWSYTVTIHLHTHIQAHTQIHGGCLKIINTHAFKSTNRNTHLHHKRHT